MSAFAASLNSTNVRNYAHLAWQRLNLAISAVLAPERAVDRAARLFTTPPRFAHTLPERELLATAKGFVVQSAVGRIAAWRFGDINVGDARTFRQERNHPPVGRPDLGGGMTDVDERLDRQRTCTNGLLRRRSRNNHRCRGDRGDGAQRQNFFHTKTRGKDLRKYNAGQRGSNFTKPMAP